jgi:hypothetical protein
LVSSGTIADEPPYVQRSASVALGPARRTIADGSCNFAPCNNSCTRNNEIFEARRLRNEPFMQAPPVELYCRLLATAVTPTAIGSTLCDSSWSMAGRPAGNLHAHHAANRSAYAICGRSRRGCRTAMPIATPIIVSARSWHSKITPWRRTRRTAHRGPERPARFGPPSRGYERSGIKWEIRRTSCNPGLVRAIRRTPAHPILVGGYVRVSIGA